MEIDFGKLENNLFYKYDLVSKASQEMLTKRRLNRWFNSSPTHKTSSATNICQILKRDPDPNPTPLYPRMTKILKN